MCRLLANYCVHGPLIVHLHLKEVLTYREDFWPKGCYQMITAFQPFSIFPHLAFQHFSAFSVFLHFPAFSLLDFTILVKTQMSRREQFLVESSQCSFASSIFSPAVIFLSLFLLPQFVLFSFFLFSSLNLLTGCQRGLCNNPSYLHLRHLGPPRATTFTLPKKFPKYSFSIIF